MEVHCLIYIVTLMVYIWCMTFLFEDKNARNMVVVE